MIDPIPMLKLVMPNLCARMLRLASVVLLAAQLGACATIPPADVAGPTDASSSSIGSPTELDLVVRRPDGEAILLEDWLAYLAKTPELRHRTEGYTGRNPKTGEEIAIAAGDGESELALEGSMVPFLSWSDGELVGRFYLFADDPRDAQRSRIAEIAQHFGAVVVEMGEGSSLKW